MKKYILFVAAVLFSISTFAQKEDTEEKKGGLKKENIFIGGSLALGFGGGGNDESSFVIGANPEIGYSLAEWADAGLAFNCISSTYKYRENGLRVKQTAFNYGIGVFTRIHPIRNVFIQLQPEYNWIDYKVRFLDQSGEVKQTVHATSFLAGIGYGQRVVGDMSFFTVLMFDLGSEIYSPYRDSYGSAVPIIRGGFNIYLGRGKKK